MSIIHNSEITFAIDIIGDAYNTTDPVEIVSKSKEILNINLTIEQVMNELTYVESNMEANNRMSMKQFFRELA